MKIGEKLVYFRNQKGLSQTEVASALGVSRAAVEHWENNAREPKFEILEKLSQIYNCQVSEFFNGDPGLNIDTKRILIDKIISDLIYEGILTEEMVNKMDSTTKQRLVASFDRHIKTITSEK